MTDRQQEYWRLIAPIEDRMMRAVWRITRDPADAEDAFQDALFTLWKRWDRVCAHPNPQALVVHICVNSAHDALRRKAREGKLIAEGAVPAEIADPSIAAIDGVSHAEQDRMVLRAIGRLPRKQAQAILLHAVEDMPYAEVAAAMDCRESTVRKHVERARARLRALLSPWFSKAHKEEASHA
jgi:RNA polymerase sigma factor (sigma-70 family)